MSKNGDIYKASGIILKDRKVLVERSVGKEYFIHPGGKIESGETAKQAVIRELKEEFQIDVREEDLELFDKNSAPAANSPEVDVHMEAFIVKKWRGEIMPDNEVEEIRWLTSVVPKDIKIGSIMEHETLPKLKARIFMKQYEYILLDWDGNLAMTLNLWLETFRQVLEEEGFHPTDEEITASFGKTDEFFAKIGVKDPEELYERADQIGRKRLPNVELYPDALEVLQYFKDCNKKTALITASNRVNVAHLLDHYNMHNLFDIFIAREDITKQKPDPESLNIAMERLGADPTRSVMIGDSDKDIGAAANAGVDSILFYPPEHKKFYDFEKLKQLEPTHIVDDFRQIMKIVK